MLPTHNTTGTTSSQVILTIKNYSIKSSDVIDQQSRITVEDEEGVLWYKTRELTEHEIVDSLTDAKTNQTRWTIHQPAKRGWYLRLRSPLFPPGACIALTPPPPRSQAHQGPGSPPSNENQRHATGGGGGGGGGEGGAGEPILVFGCQTLVPVPTTISTSTGVDPRSSVDHSYPPSRTSTSSQSQPPAYSVSSPPRQTVDITQHHAEHSTSSPASTSPVSSSPPIISHASPPKSNAHTSPHRPPRPGQQQQQQQQQRWHVTHYTIQTGIPTTGVLAGTHHHPHLVHPSTHTHQPSTSSSLFHQPPSSPSPSLLQRALAPLANLTGVGGGGRKGTHHFTIQPAPEPRVGPSSSASPDPNNPSTTTSSPNPSSLPSSSPSTDPTESSTLGNPTHSLGTQPTPTPFLTFTDSTPLLRTTPSGTLSIDISHVRTLGVEMAFWVAVSLAFWEFLREREGYLAASDD